MGDQIYRLKTDNEKRLSSGGLSEPFLYLARAEQRSGVRGCWRQARKARPAKYASRSSDYFLPEAGLAEVLPVFLEEGAAGLIACFLT